MNFFDKQNIIFIFSFSIFGFIFNFIWEWIQCSPFFIHLGNAPTVNSMLVATLGDVGLMVVVYIVISIWVGKLNWFLGSLNSITIFRIVSVSVTMAVLVELFALRTGRWAYTEKNPIIPVLEVSILPILQTILINLFSFFISKKITLLSGQGRE